MFDEVHFDGIVTGLRALLPAAFVAILEHHALTASAASDLFDHQPNCWNDQTVFGKCGAWH
jgi:hypothetical protein